MQNQPVINSENRIAHSMPGALDIAERNENSIAYSVFYYELIMNPRATLKSLPLNGVLATSKTIVNGTYPLIEPVYVGTSHPPARQRFCAIGCFQAKDKSSSRKAALCRFTNKSCRKF